MEAKGSIYNLPDNSLELVERAARRCYNSLDRMGSKPGFLLNLAEWNHWGPFEHAHMMADIICSRSASHQLVRHRLMSYCQESQRYVKYTNGIDIILPEKYSPGMLEAVDYCEEAYIRAVSSEGISAQDARAVLPNCTVTRITVTGNLRTWLHVFRMRAFNPKAQGEIRKVTEEIAYGLATKFPLFWEIYDRIEAGKVKYL